MFGTLRTASLSGQIAKRSRRSRRAGRNTVDHRPNACWSSRHPPGWEGNNLSWWFSWQFATASLPLPTAVIWLQLKKMVPIVSASCMCLAMLPATSRFPRQAARQRGQRPGPNLKTLPISRSRKPPDSAMNQPWMRVVSGRHTLPLRRSLGQRYCAQSDRTSIAYRAERFHIYPFTRTDNA